MSKSATATDAAKSTDFTSGMFLAIFGTFLFALKSIFIKLAYAEGANPTLLLMLRLAFSLPFYVCVLWSIRASEGSKPLTRRQVVSTMALGFLGYYLASFLDLSGLQYITAQLERLTLFTYPSLVAILAWMFLGERVNATLIISILLCYSGVAIMYAEEQSLMGGDNVALGVALVFGSALSYSVYILYAKRTMKSIGSRRFTSLAMIGSTFFMGVHFAATSGFDSLGQVQPIVLAYAVVLAIVCTLLPSYMINEAIMRIGATRTAVIGTVGPVLTMLLAIVVLGEPSSARHFMGMTVALAGVALVTRR